MNAADLPRPATREARHTAHEAHPHHEPHILNRWQRGVPVQGVPTWTRSFILLLALAGLAFVFAAARLVSPLGAFAGMNDAYAWGVWKTFNVMTLTALGSGGMGIGLAAWVFNRPRLHVVMRVALLTSFLFYTTGLLALFVDVGRPWNFWNILVPSRWNTHSALFEVALAMPVYCMLFLAYENSPLVVERFWYTGTRRTRAFIRRWDPLMRRLYPWMIAGAYLLPMGHQSSLGALMMLAGPKLHPLWQSQLLPLLYLIQAIICGFAFVTFILMASCLIWRRPLDVRVLDELANWVSGISLGWLALRALDLIVRGALPHVLDGDGFAAVFWTETLLVAVPAVLFRWSHFRTTPRWVFRLVILTIAGGMAYRFVPTTIAFSPMESARYFPAVPELVMTVGFIALALAAYTVAVKRFAVLPAPLEQWFEMVEHDRLLYPHVTRDRHGNPIDD